MRRPVWVCSSSSAGAPQVGCDQVAALLRDPLGEHGVLVGGELRIVTESLDRLDTTRIVIAHRLSTIIDADQIHVVDAGRTVESGTYAPLMANGGPFAALGKRQLA